MTEPINYDKVENLHIGDNYTIKESSKEGEPAKYAVKYIINIQAPSETKTPSASETYSPEEKAEYDNYMARLRANEPKSHKAKWW
ncbi:MAG: hypothetical protein KME46_32620 [Brasilonema angustatum HA4187-MV1]|jgi:hypothetical protein|nr:hypothetical protein [Brasilonema angustatum HA4187-MV1]